MKRLSSFWDSIVARRNKFSIQRLRLLISQLEKNRNITAQNEELIVENLREIAELMIYGDQHNESFFDLFLEKKIMLYFLDILSQKTGKDVKAQLLQTLSILVQNTTSETSLYYLFSNNHINLLISHEYDFDDDEVMGHYVTLLKTIALKLNKSTIQLFYDRNTNDLPLYGEAIKFFRHEESMIRAAVRAITLCVYNVDDDASRHFVLDKSRAPYFRNLSWFIREQFLSLNSRLTDDSMDEQLDHLHYLNDIFSMNISDLSDTLLQNVQDVLLEFLFQSLESRKGKMMRAMSPDETSGVDNEVLSNKVAAYLLAQFFLIFSQVRLIKIASRRILSNHGSFLWTMFSSSDEYVSSSATALLYGMLTNINISKTALQSNDLLPCRLFRARTLVESLTSPPLTTSGTGDDDLFPTTSLTDNVIAVASSSNAGRSISLGSSEADEDTFSFHDERSVFEVMDDNEREKGEDESLLHVTIDSTPSQAFSVMISCEDEVDSPKKAEQYVGFTHSTMYPKKAIDLIISALDSRDTRPWRLHMLVRTLLLLVCVDADCEYPQPQMRTSDINRIRYLYLRNRKVLNALLNDQGWGLDVAKSFDSSYREFIGVWRLSKGQMVSDVDIISEKEMNENLARTIPLWKRRPLTKEEEVQEMIHLFFLWRTVLECIQEKRIRLPLISKLKPSLSRGEKIELLSERNVFGCTLWLHPSKGQQMMYIFTDSTHVYFLQVKHTDSTENATVVNSFPLVLFEVSNDSYDTVSLSMFCSFSHPYFSARAVFQSEKVKGQVLEHFSAVISKAEKDLLRNLRDYLDEEL